MGKNEIEQFLTYLATQKNVNPTTQNQYLMPYYFYMEQVLYISLNKEKVKSPLDDF